MTTRFSNLSMMFSRATVACSAPARVDGPVQATVDGYLRLVNPLTRGVGGVVTYLAVFTVANVWGGSEGLLLASAWLLFDGTNCWPGCHSGSNCPRAVAAAS